jgi:hypothetical protein
MSLGNIDQQVSTIWPRDVLMRTLEAATSETFGMRKSQKATHRLKRFESNKRMNLYVARKKRVRQKMHAVGSEYQYY